MERLRSEAALYVILPSYSFCAAQPLHAFAHLLQRRLQSCQNTIDNLDVCLLMTNSFAVQLLLNIQAGNCHAASTCI